MAKSEYIEAGKITNTHGIAGEVRAEVWLDSPSFLKTFKRVFAGGTEYRVLSSKVHKNALIMKLEGVDTVEDASRLKEKIFTVARLDAKLPKGAFFLQDIIGARVENENGEYVGVLEEILERPASNIYVVKGETEHLIPAIPEFIMSTDPDAGLVRVRLIEGM